MTVTPSINPALPWFEQIDGAEPDVLRSLLKTFVEAFMSAEADAICGAPYGVRSEDLVNSRNGYRSRDWDTRAGSMELAIPKLRSGSYFPDWLLERRRRAERALTTVVATCYLLGVSTRRMGVARSPLSASTPWVARSPIGRNAGIACSRTRSGRMKTPIARSSVVISM